MLYIFGGLPATGKTELSRFLAKHLGAVFIRIDTIEQSLRDRGITNIYDQGYQAAFALAGDNLKLGLSVVADSTNPVTESREIWRKVADRAGCDFIEIEITCSDINEHRQRVETRQSDIPTLQLPDWNSIITREYHAWTTERIIIDTAGKTPAQSKQELLHLLGLDKSH